MALESREAHQRLHPGYKYTPANKGKKQEAGTKAAAASRKKTTKNAQSSTLQDATPSTAASTVVQPTSQIADAILDTTSSDLSASSSSSLVQSPAGETSFVSQPATAATQIATTTIQDAAEDVIDYTGIDFDALQAYMQDVSANDLFDPAAPITEASSPTESSINEALAISDTLSTSSSDEDAPAHFTPPTLTEAEWNEIFGKGPTSTPATSTESSDNEELEHAEESPAPVSRNQKLEFLPMPAPAAAASPAQEPASSQPEKSSTAAAAADTTTASMSNDDFDFSFDYGAYANDTPSCSSSVFDDIPAGSFSANLSHLNMTF